MEHQNTDKKIPVTVLTGFLGSGKTTLLNRVLAENHGKRIAVIENEFGEVGIDHELVMNVDEEIFEMNNGCICCTVRGDLIRILGDLVRRKDRFDYVLIETTGLADPGPVAQTFFMDEEMQASFELDAIVTLVDAKHVLLHLDDSDEAKEQIAFADVVLLNKCDLVDKSSLERLESRINSMNSMAKLYRTTNAKIDLERILNVGAFDLDRMIETNPTFLEPERPFEWGGIFDFDAGRTQVTLLDGPDPEMDMLVLPLGETYAEGLALLADKAERGFSETPAHVNPGEPIGAAHLARIDLREAGQKQFFLDFEAPQRAALFTQHHPDEFQMKLLRDSQPMEAIAERAFVAQHQHDDTVSSVGLRLEGALDSARVNAWIMNVLATQGQDIFRFKGVLNVHGEDNRLILQGVHMLADTNLDRPWGSSPRRTELVFIGRSLDREALTQGLASCLV